MTGTNGEVLLNTRFRAMGTDVEVLVLDGAEDLGDRAAVAIERLESKWSRFRPTSELCRLNAAGGAPVIVSKETLALLERAIDAWQGTGGRYDPTILHALEAAGYTENFDDLEKTQAYAPDSGQMYSSAAAIKAEIKTPTDTGSTTGNSRNGCHKIARASKASFTVGACGTLGGVMSAVT